MHSRSRIHVLYTGGTFGMAPDPAAPGRGLRPLLLDSLETAMSSIAAGFPSIDVTLQSFEQPLDSASIISADWLVIANHIVHNYDSFDGFVVIHGTDTLAYTASALSFLLDNLAKPVVLTGAQIPIFSHGSDAEENYKTAVQIAGYKAFDLPCIPEVVVAFGGKVLRGCRSRKTSAETLAAFESPNSADLGEASTMRGLKIFSEQLRPAPPEGAEFKPHLQLNPNILDIAIHPGLQPAHLKAMFEMPNVDGVVLRTYGAGTVPENEAFVQAIKTGLADGKPVIAVTQCIHGAVDFSTYASSAALVQAGVISGRDMTPEAALAKMMVMLGRYKGNVLRSMLEANCCGEFSEGQA
jgi:L-asparaginase